MTNTQTQIFNALNGEELIKVISAEVTSSVRVALENSGEFRTHNTFPWVKITYGVQVLAYPQQNTGDEPKIKVEGKIDINSGPPNEEAKILPEPIKVVIEDGKLINQPDKARIDAGLPIPTIAPAAGVMVDKLINRGKK